MKRMRAGSSTITKGTAIAGLGLSMVIVLTGMPGASVHAQRASYSFTRIVTLGDPAPGGGIHFNDFEPSGLNNRGDVLFGTDLATIADPETWVGEGVFLWRNGQVLELARTGEEAPGGGTFNGAPLALLSFTALNDPGDAAFTFQLSPFSFPLGVNCGVYRYSHRSRTVSPVARPGVTPAPGGGVFAGVFFGNSLNNGGDLIFPGLIATDRGIHLPDEDYVGLGIGVFKADNQDHITSVVSPGDTAPGGGDFDFATAGWINNGGDVAFTAHVAGEEAPPQQAIIIRALTGVYVKEALTGKITSIAHPGDPAPGGGVFRDAFAPVINDRGDIAFAGDLSFPPQAYEVLGVYLHSGGLTTPIARPGDPMPGGGTFVTASFVGGAQIHLNNAGQVAFNAVLSTDVNGDGSLDTGLFVWSRGSLRMVARTGTVIPGVGTVLGLVTGANLFPPSPLLPPNSGAINNDRGQVLFAATLSDGSNVLLVATLAP